jgi:hypothetical protein
VALVSGALLLISGQTLPAQVTFSDNFDDGDDSGWERYDALAPVGMNATYSFTNGGYRIQTTYLGGSAQLTGRSGSVRPDIYTDFYVAVDIVKWNDTVPQSFGLLARIGTAGLGTTTGYAFTWDRGNTNSQTSGDVDISRLDNEAPTGISLNASDAIRFQPGHSYRMVFTGKGATLEGRVYQLPDTQTPVLVVQGTDPAATPHLSGKSGLVVFDNSEGQNQTDATFDNYYASDIEPPRVTLVDQGFGDYWIIWPVDGPAFVLQATGSLNETWSDITPTGTDRGYYYYAFTPSSEPDNRFFRFIRR